MFIGTFHAHRAVPSGLLLLPLPCEETGAQKLRTWQAMQPGSSLRAVGVSSGFKLLISQSCAMESSREWAGQSQVWRAVRWAGQEQGQIRSFKVFISFLMDYLD